jgi:hypothetical protein
VNDRLLVEMRFGARHIWRVGHSGGPHVLLVSRSPSSLPALLSRSLVRLLPRIFKLFARDGGRKGEGGEDGE